jgi:hypothetical protein
VADEDTRAAERAARAAEAAAREATHTLGVLQLQAGARLDVMDELAEALRDARATMLDVLGAIDGLATVEDVQQSAAHTRTEQARRRGLTVLRLSAAVVWLVIVVAMGVNQQVEHCSPGSKANRVTTLLVQPREQLTIERLQAAARQQPPPFCDVSLPTTAHGPLDHWPTEANLAGLGGYGLVRRRPWEGEPPPPVAGVPSPA